MLQLPTTVSLLLALTSGVLSAQQLPEPSAAPLPPAHQVWPVDRIATDVAADGTVFAAAASWKAAFAANGATFHPYLGAAAPAAPATFALRAARAGEVPLAVGDAMPALAGQRVTFERGAVREQYELRTDGIEQQFVLSTLPNRGALTLDIGVATALEHHADPRGHAFRGAHGGVHYGHALAIDAAGERVALPTEWTGDALRITVPQTFMAHAQLPLLVDPLIGSITNASTTFNYELKATDVAWDASLGRFFVAYERVYSATDHDIYLAYLDAAMQPLGMAVIDISAACWERPRVATLEAHDVVGVVAMTSSGAVAPHAVRMRIVTGGGTPVVGTAFELSATHDNLEPDIGGDANAAGPSRFLVAWEHWTGAINASEMRWRMVDHTGVASAVDTLVDGIQFERRVVISKTCGKIGGATACWALVHRAEPYQQTTGELFAWFVGRDGTLQWCGAPTYWYAVVTGVTDNAGSEWDVSSPTDHEHGRKFLCVERRVDAATGRGRLVGHAFGITGNVVAADVPLVADTIDRARPVVDSDGIRFAVANEARYSATDFDVHVRTVGLVGNQLPIQDSATVSAASTKDAFPAVCAQTGQPNRYGVAWTNFASNSWRAQAQLYRGAAAANVAVRNTACGGLGIAHSGNLALGETFTLSIDNQTGFGGFLIGAAVTAPIPGCSGCTLGADGFTLLGSQLAIGVPGNPALVGATLSFQGARFDPALGPCLGSLAFSNTLDVVVQ